VFTRRDKPSGGRPGPPSRRIPDLCGTLAIATDCLDGVVLADLDERVGHWTLLDDEPELVAGKHGPTLVWGW